MTHEVVLTETALGHLRAATAYLADFDPEYAAEWYREIRAAIQTLDTRPGRNTLSEVPSLSRLRVRELHYGRTRNVYRILYTHDDHEVYILGVWHASRGRIRPSDLSL